MLGRCKIHLTGRFKYVTHKGIDIIEWLPIVLLALGLCGGGAVFSFYNNYYKAYILSFLFLFSVLIFSLLKYHSLFLSPFPSPSPLTFCPLSFLSFFLPYLSIYLLLFIYFSSFLPLSLFLQPPLVLHIPSFTSSSLIPSQDLSQKSCPPSVRHCL